MSLACVLAWPLWPSKASTFPIKPCVVRYPHFIFILFHLSSPSIFLSFILNQVSMLSREELQLFQSFAQRLQVLAPPSGASSSPPILPDTSAVNSTPPQEQHASVPTQPIPAQNVPRATGSGIQPYHSVRLSHSFSPNATQGHPSNSSGPVLLPAPLGHPSPSAPASTSSSQPFLGFNSLAVPMTSQANQRRLNAAAAHIPRPPRLPSRGRRRGPAVAPPGLPRAAGIDDCYIAVGDGTEAGIRLKVKVYPPQVRYSYYTSIYIVS